MRRIAKKQIDLEQREQFDMLRSGGGGAAVRHEELQRRLPGRLRGLQEWALPQVNSGSFQSDFDC